MRIIKDQTLLKHYIEEIGLQEHFSIDVNPLCELLCFDKDDYLIKAGQCSRYLYFLASGKIKFFSMSENGKFIPYGYSKSYRVLGEAASLFGRSPLISLQAVETSYAVAINLSRHRETLLNDNRFLRYICSLLSENVCALDNNIANLLSQSIDSRLAAFILQNAKNGIFECSLAECSELIATSYRHTLRIMNQFCDQGLLIKKRQKYEIRDFQALARIAGDAYAYYV